MEPAEVKQALELEMVSELEDKEWLRMDHEQAQAQDEEKKAYYKLERKVVQQVVTDKQDLASPRMELEKESSRQELGQEQGICTLEHSLNCHCQLMERQMQPCRPAQGRADCEQPLQVH